MANIFELGTKYEALIDRFEDLMAVQDDPTDIDALMESDAGKFLLDELKITEEEVHDKVRSYYYVMKGAAGDIQLANDEIDRLKQKIQTRERIIAKLKEFVLHALKQFGQKTDKGNYKLKLTNLSVWSVSTKSVEITDQFDEPNLCKFRIRGSLRSKDIHDLLNVINNHAPDLLEVINKETIDSEPNKTEIKKILEAGDIIIGAKLKTGEYVRFK